MAESWVWSLCCFCIFFVFFLFWFCLAIAEQPTTNQKTRNQKSKKPKNQKTKTKKTRFHTPRGEVVAESWVLSFFFGFLFFFWILVLFSHCRKTKQKLSMVAECSEKPHSQGVRCPPLRMVLQIQAQLQVRPNCAELSMDFEPVPAAWTTFRSQCKP